jgi:hypothetical protein
MMSLRATSMGVVRRAVSTRTFAFSTNSRLGLKESSSQTDADYEKHKQDSLAKQKKGSGHWKSELASDSEEAVRADRHEADPKTLQERTKHAAEEKHKSGTSSHESH